MFIHLQCMITKLTDACMDIPTVLLCYCCNKNLGYDIRAASAATPSRLNLKRCMSSCLSSFLLAYLQLSILIIYHHIIYISYNNIYILQYNIKQSPELFDS